MSVATAYPRSMTPMPGRASTTTPQAKSFALDDPAVFHTIRGHPIFDAHEGKKRKVRDPNKVSRTNPSGIVEQVLECDEDDLRTLAANANRDVAIGRPPLLRIGHEPMERDTPESHRPRPVGLTSNYSVRKIDGKSWLCADLHYHRVHAAEALTYPNISVERTGWDDPKTHTIHAVALLRRDPERPVPYVPYQSAEVGSLVCYSKESASPAKQPDPLPGELLAYSTEVGIFDPAALRRRLMVDCTFRAHYAAQHSRQVLRSQAVAIAWRSRETDPVVNYASKVGVFVPSVVRQLYAEAKARGEV